MEVCPKHSGVQSDIKTLCKFKDELVEPGGRFEKLADAINTKASRGLVMAIVVLLLGLLTTLYGLTYITQNEILSEMSSIQSDIAVIKEKVKYNYTVK